MGLFMIYADILAPAEELLIAADTLCARRASGAPRCLLLARGSESIVGRFEVSELADTTIIGMTSSELVGRTDGGRIVRAALPHEMFVSGRCRPHQGRGNLPNVPDVAELLITHAGGCLRRTSGAVDCWRWRRCGDDEPVELRRSSGLDDAIQLARDDVGTIIAVRADGRVAVLDGDPAVSIGDGDIVQLSYAGDRGCARTETGEVECWGRNNLGQTGPRTQAGSTTVPTLTQVVDIAVGAEHSCALRSTGEVLCWGSNHYGQLGSSYTPPSYRPEPVVGLQTRVDD